MSASHNIERSSSNSHRYEEIKKNVLKIMWGSKLGRIVTAGVLASGLADAAPVFAISQEPTQPQAQERKINLTEDLPSPAQFPLGAVLQLHPLHPGAGDVILTPEIRDVLVVKGRNLGKFSVSIGDDNLYWIDERVVEAVSENNESVTPQVEQEVTKTYVVVKVEEGNARSTPDTTSPANIVGQVHQGDKLERTGQVETDANGATTWHQVKLPDGSLAWLSQIILEDDIVTELVTQPILTTEPVTPSTTSPITNTENITVTPTVSTTEAITNSEGIGGNIEDEKLLSEAKEQLGAENVTVLSLINDSPLALEAKSTIEGVYKNSKWEAYTFPEDIGDTQTAKILEEVKKIYPNAKDASFSIGTVSVMDESGKVIATVKNDEIIPETERSLVQFISSRPEFRDNLSIDSLIIKRVNGTIIGEVNNVYFILLPDGWQLAPADIESQLNQATYVPDTSSSNEYLVQQNEIQVNIAAGFDFEGKATLDENAGQIILQWLAEAIAQSDVLAPIMGSTTEDVLNYLRTHNYQLPPEFKLPTQLPRVFADVSTHDQVKFVESSTPIYVNNITLQFAWNDQANLYQDVEPSILWSGNSPGFDGSGMYVGADGNLHLIAVVKRRDLYEDPSALESTASRRIFIAERMIASYNGNEMAQGDSNAFQQADQAADSISKPLLKTTFRLVAVSK